MDRPVSLQHLLKLVGRPLMKLLFTVEYHGVEHVPASGPVILAGNHPSYLDPILVALPIRRDVKFMAWDALFRVPLLGWLIRRLGAFPVDLTRGKGDAAFRKACEVLNQDHVLGIFPEGQRSESGPMGEPRTGVARLAIETGAAIVPISIGGASRAWPKHKLLPKPAKIIVRFHPPIRLDGGERARLRDDRGYHQRIMREWAARVNRSLHPSLRGAAQWDRWYRQPPSHIRTYEWVPLIALVVASAAALLRGELAAHLWWLVLPPALYYLYLAADLTLIPPSRGAKWARNSMPVWLMIGWHGGLTGAAGLPPGEMNAVTLAGVLGAFFTYFWEDYYTLQKFMRGLVVGYYASLALMLGWPEPLGLLVASFTFIIAFSLLHRTVFYGFVAAALGAVLAGALYAARAELSWRLLAYAGLALVTLGYLQSFVSAAYDIRKAGEVR